MAGRALQPLTREHLTRLVDIAARDRDALFRRKPHLQVYRDRILSVALCQGGALHYLDGKNGVKDLDVWTLYAAHPDCGYPHRRTGEADFGPSELEGWSGRVDILGRSLPVPVGGDPAPIWQKYLRERRTTTAYFLSLKAVVLLEPADRRGEVVWPKG